MGVDREQEGIAGELLGHLVVATDASDDLEEFVAGREVVGVPKGSREEVESGGDGRDVALALRLARRTGGRHGGRRRRMKSRKTNGRA